jgi:DNA-binding MarR family transcriptional regulator
VEDYSAAAERVTPPTMSKLVRAMEGEGLVRRERDPGDARARCCCTGTGKGRRILERGRARRLDVLEQPLVDVSAADVDAVQTAADVVERALRSS